MCLSDSDLFTACARAAHEANRAYCIAQGDTSQVPWEHAPTWQRESALAGVEGVLRRGHGPRDSHAHWMAGKIADGWSYGPVKNPDAKEHPCMVPYDDLPEAQRRKDALFVSVVRAMAHALGAYVPAMG